ncbi:hypothetical protein N0V94_000378 [Neodidymelliopsis sp. IMI 364377]|nr:hypothetical protein N0V94_000378 [Neodidymelliopsis sp. IMI 364377]
MANNRPTAIRCRHCNRQFADISAEYGLVPGTSQTPACASCEPFSSLYAEVQAADQQRTVLDDRGPKHHGRTLAYSKLRNARVALENFLINIEAPKEASLDVAQAGFAKCADPVQLERPGAAADSEPSDQDQRGVSPQTERLSPTTRTFTPKRQSTRETRRASWERKRIKFTESVEERPEYRDTDAYHRNGGSYVPGRYVATEGCEYLDTSGSTLTFAKFTGQKKVGSKFIDVLPKKEAEQNSSGCLAVKGRKQQQDLNVENTTRNDFNTEESKAEPSGDGTLLANRSRRYAARPRSTTPPVMKKMRNTRNTQANRQKHGEQQELGKDLSLVVTLKTCYQPESNVATNAKGTTKVPENEEQSRKSSRSEHCDLTVEEAAEAANIKRIVTNIQRELDNLRQSSITPKYTNLASTAIQGCSRALEPLHSFLLAEPDRAGVVKEIAEEDSVHVDAHDPGKDLASTDTTYSEGVLQSDYKQESTYTTKQHPSKASITAVCKGSEGPDHISHQSRGLASLPLASGRRSGRLSLTEPLSYYTPLYDSEPVGSSEAKPKRRSSAPSLAARKDSEDP